jgi:hypothetical protein
MGSQAKYLTDERGEKISVVLDIAEYQKLMEDAEELEAIRAYGAAKVSGNGSIPFDQATKEIERSRK